MKHYKFGEYIKDREFKFTGVKPKGTDLIRIIDAIQYFKDYLEANAKNNL